MASARNYKKEYAARSDKIKAYRKKNKVKDKMRTSARRKVKRGKGNKVKDKEKKDVKNQRKKNKRIK